jgi:hypothetical protein
VVVVAVVARVALESVFLSGESLRLAVERLGEGE